MYENPWIYSENLVDQIPDKAIGFVYLITHLSTGQKYIGKKLFHRLKTIQKNKKKRKIRVESDWKVYYGSNECLKLLVLESDPYEFSREILHICYSKSQCSYLEIKEQLLRDVILSDDYFNDWICCKITRIHMKRFRLFT